MIQSVLDFLVEACIINDSNDYYAFCFRTVQNKMVEASETAWFQM